MDDRNRHMIMSLNRRPGKRRRIIRIVAWAFLLLVILLGGSYIAWSRKVQHDIAQALIPGTSERFAVEQAIEKFHRYSAKGSPQIEYVEPWKEGVLVFYQTGADEQYFNISVEYFKRAWRGWKWVNGGGMGGSRPIPDIHYAYLPNYDRLLHQFTPFPIVFGVLDDNERSIRIEGPDGPVTNITLYQSVHQLGWFAYLPNKIGVQYKLTAYDADGNAVVTSTLDTNDYIPDENHVDASATDAAS